MVTHYISILIVFTYLGVRMLEVYVYMYIYTYVRMHTFIYIWSINEIHFNKCIYIPHH
jgi:hypothetical protein